MSTQSMHTGILLITLLIATTSAQLPQPGVYYKETVNTCINPIESNATECLLAAQAVHTGVVVGNADKQGESKIEYEKGFPFGCYLYNNVQAGKWEAYLNMGPQGQYKDDTRTGPRLIGCGDYNCVCRGGAQVEYGFTTSHVTTGNHANCEAAGKHVITSAERCAQAANQASLGLNKIFTSAGVQKEGVAEAPRGCYVSPSGKLFLNTYTGTDVPTCNPNVNHRGCLCANAIPAVLHTLPRDLIEQFYHKKFATGTC